MDEDGYPPTRRKESPGHRLKAGVRRRR